MLKRIHSLQNIGRYKNCKAGGHEFGRLTIIYGRNTYGKTTLGDVFASIQAKDVGLISARTTIPNDGKPQHISLGFLPLTEAKEVTFVFENGAWVSSPPDGLEIRTFDDGFIHRNVFAARQFNRDTKENFSAFILGEKGVNKAEQIKEKKQERHKASRDVKQLEKVAFKDVDDVKSFLKHEPMGTQAESNEKLESLRTEHKNIRKQQEQILAIQSRSQGAPLSCNSNFQANIQALNLTLGLGLEGVHEEAKAQVTQHINMAFQTPHGAEQWIRQGIRENKGDHCQFCGQKLSEDAHNLLELYRKAFDDNFEKHDTAVKSQLNTAIAQADDFPVNELRVTLAKNSAAFSSYEELQSNKTYTSEILKLDDVAKKIETALDSIAEETPAMLNRLREVATKKQNAPHLVLDPVDEGMFHSLLQQVEQRANEYNSSVEVCNAEITAFKGGVNVEDLKHRLEKNIAEGKAEGLNNIRIKLVSECAEYIALNEKLKKLGADIETLEKELQTDQSEYLKKFFDSLNTLFKRFGSRDFLLERGESKQGHTPVFFLKVQYKGQSISESAISQVFSESDRRALALAVFWTQLQSLPTPVLAQQIVVLDDPLTSFDDARVTAVHLELTKAIDSVRQIIVLSHYRHDIEMFLETYRSHPDAKLLVLTDSGETGTDIEVGDPREFLLTEHEKAHERLTAFSEGHTNDYSFGDLRIFFEAELDSRFAAQRVQYSLSALQLGEKIDRLCELDVISEDIKKQCHQWRTVLNPSHHTWSGADLENQRNTVRDFLDFVYNRLIRQQ